MRRDVRAGLFGLLLVGACSSGPIALGRLDDPNTGAAPDGGDARAPNPDVTPPGDDSAVCDPPLPARHYTFDGVGTEVVDARGGPSGHVLGGATLDGTGIVRLDGVDDYVDLPNGILAGLGEVTVAVWVRRLGGPAYTRIFDFGTSSIGEDPPAGSNAGGRTYLAATPGTGNVPSGLAVLMSTNGPAGESVAVSNVELDKEMRFVAVAVAKDTLSLFYEGGLVARVPRVVSLADIVDDNSWLGRSQYVIDPYLTAEISDVRIYPQALSECAVRKLYVEGANPPP